MAYHRGYAMSEPGNVTGDEHIILDMGKIRIFRARVISKDEAFTLSQLKEFVRYVVFEKGLMTVRRAAEVLDCNLDDVEDLEIPSRAFEYEGRNGTVRFVPPKEVKCNDGLHVYCGDYGAIKCRLADDKHKQNAFAVEDLVGPYVVLDMETGLVFNKGD